MPTESDQPGDRQPEQDDLARVFAPPTEPADARPGTPAGPTDAAPTDTVPPTAVPSAAVPPAVVPPAAVPPGPVPPGASPYAPPAGAPYGSPYAPPGSAAGNPYAWPQGGYPGYPPGYPGHPGWQQGQREWSGYAITSLVTGILGLGCCLWAVSIGFGIAALVTIPKRNQRGKGMAIAGIVLSCLWLLFGVLLAVLGAFGSHNGTSDSTGPYQANQHSNTITVYELRPGDCFDKLNDTDSALMVQSLPCDGPHYGEVFGIAQLGSGPFPGEQSVVDKSDQGCRAKVADYLDGNATVPDSVQIRFFHPTSTTWVNPEHHFATCMFVGKSGKLTDSVHNMATSKPTPSAAPAV